MSYCRRPNPKSNWKRPKPKIYDCNTRDMEKFYQSNYNDYLSLKNEFRARDLDKQSRGDPEELTRRFEQRRASSLVYGEDDAPRTHRLIPNRQNSNDGSTETSSYLRTRMEQSESSVGDLPSRTTRSTTSSSKTVSFNTANDGESEMAGIEQRLDRLKRLREELGLPSEPDVNGSSSTGATKSKYSSSFEVNNSSDNKWSSQGSNARSASVSRGSPSRNVESSYVSKTSRSSARNGLGDEESSTSYTSRSNRFKASDNDDDSTTYTSRTSRFKAPNADDESTSSYTSRRSRFKAPDNDEDVTSTYTSRTSKYKTPNVDEENSTYTSRSSKYKTSGDTNGFDDYESPALKSRQKVPKPSLDDIDMKFDDETLLSDMRKKIPSSSEILDRIKNMDID